MPDITVETTDLFIFLMIHQVMQPVLFQSIFCIQLCFKYVKQSWLVLRQLTIFQQKLFGIQMVCEQAGFGLFKSDQTGRPNPEGRIIGLMVIFGCLVRHLVNNIWPPGFLFIRLSGFGLMDPPHSNTKKVQYSDPHCFKMCLEHAAQ